MNAPAAEAAEAPRKRRSGWWFLAKLIGGLLVLAVGTLWFWVRSDGDLRTARERITAAGFPTTGAEMGRKRSDEARIKAWLRLETLTTDKTKLYVYYQQPNGFAVPGTSLPPDFLAYVAALPPVAMAEAGALIDELGDGPVVHDVSLTVTTRISTNSRLSAITFHHALLCPASDLPVALERFDRISTWHDPDSLYFVQSRTYVVTQLTKALLYRRLDLTMEQRRRFADRLLELTINPGHQLARSQAAALVVDLDFYLDPLDRSKRGGATIQPVLMWPIAGSMFYRAGRGPLLQQELDWAIFLRDHRDDLRAIIAEALRRQPTSKGDWTLLLNPNTLLSHLTSRIRFAPYQGQAAAKSRLGAELVAAVLRDEPWPVDWFDPTGAKLRPITLDGKVTGAYSVGPDGVDDGGTSNTDTRWALFGPIDPPKP
jgi:hypothetical protein